MKLTSKRKCGECTACCQGWLTSIVHGHPMSPGIKCHFLGNGCSIYKDRPQDPCKAFKCQWLADEDFMIPEWMKPSLSNVIITTKSWGEDRGYWLVVECGKKMESDVLHWILTHCEQHRIPLEYQVNGQMFRRGPKEFMEFFENNHGRSKKV